MIEKERARLIYQTMNRIRCFELKPFLYLKPTSCAVPYIFM